MGSKFQAIKARDQGPVRDDMPGADHLEGKSENHTQRQKSGHGHEVQDKIKGLRVKGEEPVRDSDNHSKDRA